MQQSHRAEIDPDAVLAITGPVAAELVKRIFDELDVRIPGMLTPLVGVNITVSVGEPGNVQRIPVASVQERQIELEA